MGNGNRAAENRTRLRVLYLEDNPLDATLVRETLRREGVECEVVHVPEQADFERELAAGGFDAVLADYNLPRYSGEAALRLVRSAHPDLPFIFVSGSIGEERAVEHVKCGATDYVMKDNLRRLPVALRRAIVEAEGARQRREAEAKLQADREFQEDVFASVQAGVVVLDTRLEIVRANPTLERMFPEQVPLEGKAWASIHSSLGMSSIPSVAEEVIRTGKAAQAGGTLHTALGEIEVNCFASPVVERRSGRVTGVIMYLRDETREKALQRELIQSQKMQCVGQLAGGVAHDFNNVLQAIMAFNDMLAAATPAGDPRQADINEIRKAVERGSTLTRQLLAFSRKQVLSTAVLDLNALTKGMGKMLARLIGANIAFEFDLDPGLAPVLGDAGQIEQVILNLVVNARDAMPDGGHVTVTTCNVGLSGEEAARHGSGWRAGRFVRLCVRDTGKGMTPEVMQHLFEPFFTTKEAGKGTGLGLSTVYGIVQQHGGWVDVASRPGGGAEFAVYLPVHAKENVPSAPENVRPPERSGLVLVVEDDPLIVKLILRALEMDSVPVSTAGSVAEARETFARHRETVSLLLSDVMLGDGNGVELAVEFQAEKPSLRVLMMSGHLDEHSRGEEIQLHGFTFLPKPFGIRELLDTVRRLSA